MRPTWLVEHKVNLLIQMGLDKDPTYPEVPLLRDLTADSATKSALDLIFLNTKIQRPVLAPPDIPADRLAILRRAFTDAMADPALVADAASQKIDLIYQSGEEVQSLVEQVHRLPPEIVKLAMDLAS
jgi:hypothetical protein